MAAIHNHHPKRGTNIQTSFGWDDAPSSSNPQQYVHSIWTQLLSLLWNWFMVSWEWVWFPGNGGKILHFFSLHCHSLDNTRAITYRKQHPSPNSMHHLPHWTGETCFPSCIWPFVHSFTKMWPSPEMMTVVVIDLCALIEKNGLACCQFNFGIIPILPKSRNRWWSQCQDYLTKGVLLWIKILHLPLKPNTTIAQVLEYTRAIIGVKLTAVIINTTTQVQIQIMSIGQFWCCQ